ncbi:WD40/PQQ-like beta propeller repeat containing protein (plasmid) [Halapricum desulfuricans]|uniref:WD40/PQQ-like beta propeller repeat containing protein n=1 Tax=Halapricum desulfuricans TaxID=2841257 RepID=A0A897NLV1_9EURY|nr:PQQ-binding-like beta-propeller repeat protein [Halapricum desulfuricans]QSG13424.1 WD40/PQQ-like beta propeller repeat containing protein [Halapricum desulfuricans]
MVYETTMPGPTEDDRIPEAVAPLPLPDFAYDDLEEGERVGTGGDADVYRATINHNNYTYPVAVKEPRFGETIQQRVVEKFQTEAETWRSLNDHDNIVSVYSSGAEPLPWLALEFMDGGTLDAQIGSLDVAEALWLSGRIAEGVRHGHRHGVAHLDIKPTNVLLRDTPDGKWKYPKVSDWGLAKMLLKHSDSTKGISPTYAAPEQFDAEEYGSPDDLTDIYQLGALVYALVAGEPPFSGSSTAVMQGILQEEPDPPSTANSSISAAADEIILKALAKKKGDRYESVLLFKKELDRLFEEYIEGDIDATTPRAASPANDLTDRTSETSPDLQNDTAESGLSRTAKAEPQTQPSSVGSHTGSPSSHMNMDNHIKWPMFGPDPSNTSYVEVSGPREGISENWDFNQAAAVSPVVADELLYGSVSGPINENRDDVYALSLDGEEKWRYESGEIRSPSLAIDEDVLIACESFDGRFQEGDDYGLITALDRFTGTVKWQIETGHVIFSAPTIVGGTVYVGSHDSNLYAIDIRSGTIEWRFETNAEIFTTPSVANGTVYFGSGRKDAHIYAVDTKTGREQWRFKTGEYEDFVSAYDEGGIFNAMPIKNGVLYAGGIDERLYALDADSGAEKWNFKAKGSINSSPAVNTDNVFFSTSDDIIYAVNTSDGALNWKAEVPTSKNTRPILAEDTLLLGAGILRAFDADSGTELWNSKADRGASHPVILEEKMYIGFSSYSW